MLSTPYLTSVKLNQLEFISHGFFTRQGGKSVNEFDSLNCSPSSGDDAGCIGENRSRVMYSLGATKLVSLKQIHSNKVIIVDQQFENKSLHEADAMVTRQPGIGLGVLGADCAAVLMADEKNCVIAAAHGGWQGALTGVVDNAVDAMCELGAEASQIVAAIGPAIQQRSYEVGEEFVKTFLDRSPIECQDCFQNLSNGSAMHFDLTRYLKRRLIQKDVRTIDVFSEDTYADEQQFFSYRRSYHRGEIDYGRQISTICIR